MRTTYAITDERLSPTTDIVTATEFRAYCADMNDTNEWNLDLDSIETSESGITMTLDGDRVQVADVVGANA